MIGTAFYEAIFATRKKMLALSRQARISLRVPGTRSVSPAFFS